MFRNSCRRGAVTFTEILVVIALPTVVLARLLVAVVRVRESAARTESQNKVRQIILGVQNMADAFGGRLPVFDPGPQCANADQAPLVALLPFLDQGAFQFFSNIPTPAPNLSVFISPSDPTAANGAFAYVGGMCRYAANGQVFVGDPRLSASIPDGSSNTIGFAEHYGYRCGAGAVVGDGVNFQYFVSLGVTFTYWDVATPGRATFADPLQGVVPYTSGEPPISTASVYLPSPGPTFQTSPTQANCDPGLAQTPHPSGMLVALMDGSVRTLAPGMSETTIWAAVTPAGGETPGGDW